MKSAAQNGDGYSIPDSEIDNMIEDNEGAIKSLFNDEQVGEELHDILTNPEYEDLKSYTSDETDGNISSEIRDVIADKLQQVFKAFGDEVTYDPYQNESKTMKLKEFMNNESVSVEDLFSNDVSRELKLKDLIRR